MGKHEAMTAKAVANRIKAKGLNKLRWYCQACEKSCRDENGFKCHINSEAHQRAMLLVAENATKVLTDFSQQFKRGFVDILRTRYGTRRVLANQVYNEYIADRHHVHMNSTCWSTLSAFCMHLGREGDAKVEESDRGGWYVTYIDRSPEALRRMERDARREREERDAEADELALIEEQIRRASALAPVAVVVESTPASDAADADNNGSNGSNGASGNDDDDDFSAVPPPAVPAPKLARPTPFKLALKPRGKVPATAALGGPKRSLSAMMSTAAATAPPPSSPSAPSSTTAAGDKLHALIDAERERKQRIAERKGLRL
ncbi:domain of Kin17 curved DNA-binding protein-domain-containing protein [Blastocladiella britannica]|nr:domain of Kin17 curved DNA-binding protein-domain-containing protein [Blastocladiella britannica]